jgi:hypothetical protein
MCIYLKDHVSSIIIQYYEVILEFLVLHYSKFNKKSSYLNSLCFITASLIKNPSMVSEHTIFRKF